MSDEQTTDHDRTTDHEGVGRAGSPPPPGVTATMPPPQAPAPGGETGIPAGSNSGRRAIAVLAIAGFAVVGTALFAIALAAAVIVGAIIGIAVDGNAERITHTPSAIEEVPTSIVADEADVVIDLTSLPSEDFDGRTEALALDIDVEFGSVEIIVPDGMTVSVDAETDLGSTRVFDLADDGFSNRVVVDGGVGSDLDLTIDVEVGEIDVVRN